MDSPADVIFATDVLAEADAAAAADLGNIVVAKLIDLLHSNYDLKDALRALLLWKGDSGYCISNQLAQAGPEVQISASFINLGNAKQGCTHVNWSQAPLVLAFLQQRINIDCHSRFSYSTDDRGQLTAQLHHEKLSCKVTGLSQNDTGLGSIPMKLCITAKPRLAAGPIQVVRAFPAVSSPNPFFTATDTEHWQQKTKVTVSTKVGCWTG